MELEQKVTLSDLSGGALQEIFAKELQRVIENVADPNTPWKDKRTITVKIEFAPQEDRALAASTLKVVTKLAPTAPIKTTFLIGEDSVGRVITAEYQKQVKGQTYVDPDTGEISIPPSGFNRVSPK